jgi:hypothetical protein
MSIDALRNPIPYLRKVLLLPLAAVAALALWFLCALAETELPGIGPATDTTYLRGLYALFCFWRVASAVFSAPTAPPAWYRVPARIALWWCVLPASILIARVTLPFLTCGIVSSAAGSALGPLCVYLSHRATSTGWSRFARGSRIVTEGEARDAIDSVAPRAASEPPLRWAGLKLPASVSEGHFAVVGAIGSGKTLMHRELMASVLPHVTPGSDRRAILYDVKGDAPSALRQMGVPTSRIITLNPFDERSFAWDIAADVDTVQRAAQLARALVPEQPQEREPFFTNAARDVLREVLTLLIRSAPGKWTLRDLIHVTASPARLRALLSATENGREFIDQYRQPPTTFRNFVQHLGTALRPLQMAAALWDHAERRISFREWKDGVESILLFDARAEHRASLVPANRLMFDFLSPTLISGPESPGRARYWVFLDELQDASRLDGLIPLLNLGRSKGVRCVLGFQDLEGLHLAYGQHEGDKLAALAANVSLLRLTSTRTADWGNRRVGDAERWEYTHSWSDKTSISEHLQRRDVVMPSELLNLPYPSAGTVHGFHLIKGVAGVIERAATLPLYEPDPSEDFRPRPTSGQHLREWSDADAERLGLRFSPKGDDAADDEPSVSAPRPKRGRGHSGPSARPDPATTETENVLDSVERFSLSDEDE